MLRVYLPYKPSYHGWEREIANTHTSPKDIIYGDYMILHNHIIFPLRWYYSSAENSTILPPPFLYRMWPASFNTNESQKLAHLSSAR